MLNTSYKILAEIQYQHLSIYADDIIGEYQGGFRIGRSTTDQILTIRQIMEKSLEIQHHYSPVEDPKYLTLDRKHGSRIGQNITIDEYNFEVVQSFKYLGSIVNVENDVVEEIKMRLSQGNRCFYALKHLFRSTLASRNTKLLLYKTLIRPNRYVCL